MSYKSILTLTVAVVFLGVAGLSNSAVAWDPLNSPYNNGKGNGGEDVNGDYVASEVGDWDPAELDVDAAADAAEAAADAAEDAADAAEDAAELLDAD